MSMYQLYADKPCEVHSRGDAKKRMMVRRTKRMR